MSNRVTENGSKKDGQPNVTKKNGSTAAATGGVQRSVTMETREEVEVSAGDSSSGTANSAADAEALAGPVAASSSVPNPSALTAESLAAYMSAGGTAASAVGSTAYQYSGPADDIDERDSDDPLCATSYVQEMYEHFRIKEVSTSVRPVYMEDQSFINERMRSILVDWLVEVHLKFKLVPETLYLTINVIDRYLSKTEVSRPKLQLVGVTALLIASKYEEIYPPELRDLVYICDRAYSKMEVSPTDFLCYSSPTDLMTSQPYLDPGHGGDNSQEARVPNHHPERPRLPCPLPEGGSRGQEDCPAVVLHP